MAGGGTAGLRSCRFDVASGSALARENRGSRLLWGALGIVAGRRPVEVGVSAFKIPEGFFDFDPGGWRNW